MAVKLEARLATNTTTLSTLKAVAWVEQAAIAMTPAEVSVVPMTYQRLRVRVVSTIGAHRNFQVCGRKESAMSSPICDTAMPDCDNRYPSVTVR